MTLQHAIPMVRVPAALVAALPDLERELSQLRRVVAGGFTTPEKVREAYSALMRMDKASLAARKAMRAKA